MEVKATFVVKNLTESALENLRVLPPKSMWQKLLDYSSGDLRHCVTFKAGNGTFRDRVDVNHACHAPTAKFSVTESPRTGYRLFTFHIVS